MKTVFGMLTSYMYSEQLQDTCKVDLCNKEFGGVSPVMKHNKVDHEEK